jgi:hypothetical protein
LFPLFAPSVNDTGGKFAAGVVDTGGNLPPASLTPGAAGIVDTGGKFATRKQHKGNWWKNLPTVSLTLVVHLDMRISLRIFEKIRNDPTVIFRGSGEGDSRKNLK